MGTNQTSDNTQLIAELHTALNAVTALFVSFHGFEYGCVNQALTVLEKRAIRKSAWNLRLCSHSLNGTAYVESCEIFTRKIEESI